MALKRIEAVSGCWAKAGDDEPLFVLRAKDVLAPDTVRWWADELWANTDEGDVRREQKVAEARALADQMEAWQREHGAKRSGLEW